MESKEHKLNAEKWLNLQKSKISGGSILSRLSSAHDMEIKENREYFTKICEIIKYLCKKGLALRGHDESLESKTKEILLNFANYFQNLI